MGNIRNLVFAMAVGNDLRVLVRVALKVELLLRWVLSRVQLAYPVGKGRDSEGQGWKQEAS